MKMKLKQIKENKGLKIGFMIVKALMTFLIILIVSIIFVQRISNNKVTIGGYSMFTIVTESMVPKYEVGDMLLAKKTAFEDIKVGDDLVYLGKEGAFNGKVVTHQVIDIEKDGDKYLYHTKGIANTIEDPVVDSSQIYGVVVAKSNILSFLSKIVNNIYGFYFIVFIPFAVMIFFEFIYIIHDKDKIKG